MPVHTAIRRPKDPARPEIGRNDHWARYQVYINPTLVDTNQFFSAAKELIMKALIVTENKQSGSIPR